MCFRRRVGRRRVCDETSTSVGSSRGTFNYYLIWIISGVRHPDRTSVSSTRYLTSTAVSLPSLHTQCRRGPCRTRGSGEERTLQLSKWSDETTHAGDPLSPRRWNPHPRFEKRSISRKIVKLWEVNVKGEVGEVRPQGG